jgi:GntR family transcriptional repressor for pyruvate dehydrogenase complex
MAFQKIKQEKVSDTVAGQIEQQIASGVLKPGERLPSERELARQLNVSRPSVREAIQKLIARRLLETRRGGGTYISTEFGESFTDPLLELLGSRPETAYDLLEFRDALEGLASFYAAQRANDADKEIIRLRYQRLIEAHERKDYEAEATADVDFHLAIAEASHNVVLLHVMRSMFSLLHRSIELSFKKLYLAPSAPEAIPAQHLTILNAILSGDAEQARSAAHAHLRYVQLTLDEIARDEDRSHTSMRRLRNLTRG